MKNKSHIVVRLLIGIVAFQVLNLSISNSPNFADIYSYYYSTQTGSDPTEAIVELIVEARYGQQDIFTCKTCPETNKSSCKAFYYQPDLISEEQDAAGYSIYSPDSSFYDTDEKVVAFPGRINVPPPKI